MKKILAILLSAMLMLALTACGGATNAIKDATTDEQAKAVKSSDFEKDFQGLQDYLLTKGYIYSKDGNNNSLKSEIYFDVIGANDGIRYNFLDGRSFVEFYDFSGEQNDTAKKVLEDIKDDGKFKAIDGLDELTAKISKSGKYIISYNANNKYDYDKITEALEEW